MLTKAEKTKQLILEASVPIFNRKGISAANIEDVLEATKLTKGCLYGHFNGKEDLALQVVDYMLQKNSQALFAAVSRGKTAKTRVFAYLDFYKDPLSYYISGGCPIVNMAVEADGRYPAVREKVAGVIRQGQELFVGILKAGIAAGEFSEKLDPAIYAFKAVASIQGAVVMCRSLNTAKPMQGLIKSLKAELNACAK